MSDPIYNWKRFWFPRGIDIHLEEGGYLTDPDSSWGRRVNAQVVPLEAIADKKCLALLAGPGWGKSRTVESAERMPAPAIQQQSGKLLRFDLGVYGSDDRLVNDVFKGDEIISWAKGDYPLHLFLDSLDEGLQQAKTLAGVILQQLRSGKYPIERLYFRIICRTADWYDSFEQGLRQLWGDRAVGIYKLARFGA